ncbi:MAG: NUDIX hydrolase [Rhodospirillaceae bacterium]|nr:NUDIX hydrolase [Rhodospirillaceae bacterium]MCY4309936.1 NUDIX hydrolase [Rhodospirillaceae bacterium]
MKMESAPNRPLIGVGVVVWKGEKVLLIRRGKLPMRGRWSLPGGRQELGETVRETAVREVKEETAVDIRVGALIEVLDAIYREKDGTVSMQYTLVDFDGDWLSGDLEAGDDADHAEWVNIDNLPGYDLWEETLRVITLSRAQRALDQS